MYALSISVVEQLALIFCSSSPLGSTGTDGVLSGQWDNEPVLGVYYTLYNYLVGESYASSGSQQTQVISANNSSNVVAWETTWNWEGGVGEAKSC